MNVWAERFNALSRWQRIVGALVLIFLALAITRSIAHAGDMTSGPTFVATIVAASPIIFVALGGLFSERSGIANIGLEGMMILGTWGGAWAGWHWGPWGALLGGAVFGMLGGLLHALATVTFGVDQIVSGVAINFIAPGIARFLSSEIFVGKGSNHEGTITSSPAIKDAIGRLHVPGVSTWLRDIDKHRWFFVSDVAGALYSFVDKMAWSTLIALLLIPVTIYVLWHTPFGLRLRSIGEKPSASESVGIPVYRMQYTALAISGALAGLGGAWLVVDVRQYVEGQTGGRGFIGLAALIFGNWQPIGVAIGAGLFSYGLALANASGTKPVRGLYLFIAEAFLLIGIVVYVRTRSWKVTLAMLLIGGALVLFYIRTPVVNNQIVYITPYVIVLVVITFAAGRSRPPAWVGRPWRKGQVS